MLVTTELQRSFIFKENGQEIKLTDPATELSPEAVMNFYSATYPVLTTSTVEGPVIKDDEVQYTFRTVIGTKG